MALTLRDVRFWLLAGALLLTLTALLAPKIARTRNVYDVLAVVDITGSMNTRDMGPAGAPVPRLEAARVALQHLVGELPCQSRLGLGIFTERRTFLLLEPVETCANFAALEGAVGGLDWRMAWEGDSYVAKGVYSAIDAAKRLDADLVFLTDGHEAPPLPMSGMPEFDGKLGEVKGLVVGVGGKTKSPIPKFDDDGHEIGSWSMHDVPQENHVGAPPKGMESRPGYHPKWAPFGAGEPEGEEHLSSVRTEHLLDLAAKTGLAYAELLQTPALAEPLMAAAHPRPVTAATDAGPYPAAAALLLLAVLFGVLPLVEHFGRSRPRKAGLFPSHQIQQGRYPSMQRVSVAAAVILLALCSTGALAHGPTPQKVDETIDIAVPPAQVWALVKDFAALSTWHPGVTKSEVTGGNVVGATRTATLKSGETLVDGLDEVNDGEMSVSYRQAKENLAALPVSFYSATISVKPEGSGSQVEWIGRFYRGDTSNFPPENLNDEAAVKAMTDFLHEGLAGLKAKLEAKP